MDEVAAVAVNAEVVVFETAAFLGLVFRVVLVVLAEFAEPVCKFAPLLVGTVPVLHVLFAELGLKLGILAINGSFLVILGGVGVALLVGPLLSSLLAVGGLQLSS